MYLRMNQFQANVQFLYPPHPHTPPPPPHPTPPFYFSVFTGYRGIEMEHRLEMSKESISVKTLCSVKNPSLAPGSLLFYYLNPFNYSVSFWKKDQRFTYHTSLKNYSRHQEEGCFEYFCPKTKDQFCIQKTQSIDFHCKQDEKDKTSYEAHWKPS